MATLPGPAFPALPSLSISTTNLYSSILTPSPALPFGPLRFRLHVHGFSSSFRRSTVTAEKPRRLTSIKAVEEEEKALYPAAQQEEVEDAPSSFDQPSVTVPVSPSDTLTMLFQAEGTMSESGIPTVTDALQGQEDITNLKVQVVEGIASVELTKQTTVQATGVASSLIETIQGSGLKLQTLSLSFEDEEEVFV